ncbi:MAG: GxxExxY protein [Thermoflexales bacterium]|nr:GxxExxY protein [Thermoflexales bacterium]
MKDWLYQDITADIISAYYKVYNSLKHRRAYSEENFAQALLLELARRQRSAKAQVAVQRRYEGQRIGHDFVDLVIDDKVIAEVKKVPAIKEVHLDQLRTYLLDGNWAVGLLLNFGGDEPEFRRLENRPASESSQKRDER